MASRFTPLLVAATICASAGAAAAFEAHVTAPTELRAGPGMRHHVVAMIPANAAFEAIDCRRWCQVQYGGAMGYVQAPLVVSGAPASDWDNGPFGLLMTPFAAADAMVGGGYGPAPQQQPPVVASY